MASLQAIIEHLRQGSPEPLTPSYMEISVMGHCNFGCVQCHQHHHMQEDRTLFSGAGPSRLALPRTLELLDEAAEMGVETVELCGRGEPTLHPGIDLMVRRLKEREFRGNLITNGSHISDALLAALGETRFDEVSVSIYGYDQKTFAATARPRGGVDLERVLQNLERIKAAAPASRLTVTLLIQRDWLDGLGDLAPLMDRIPADRFEFVVARPYSSGIQITTADGRDRGFANALATAWNRVRDGVHKPRPELAEFIERYLADPQVDTIRTTYSRIPCYAGHWAIFIADDGTVRPCSNSNWVLGDAMTTPLREIWLGDTYGQFRAQASHHMIRTGQPLPRSYCTHCGWAFFQERFHEAVQGAAPTPSGLGVY